MLSLVFLTHIHCIMISPIKSVQQILNKRGQAGLKWISNTEEDEKAKRSITPKQAWSTSIQNHLKPLHKIRSNTRPSLQGPSQQLKHRNLLKWRNALPKANGFTLLHTHLLFWVPQTWTFFVESGKILGSSEVMGVVMSAVRGVDCH